MSIFKEITTEICAESGIRYEEFSHGYIIRLTKGEKIRHIFGQHMDINAASADRIACDKVACYTLLKNFAIPAIEHELFFNPRLRINWIGETGTWRAIHAFFEKHNRRFSPPNPMRCFPPIPPSARSTAYFFWRDGPILYTVRHGANHGNTTWLPGQGPSNCTTKT
jgi:hypothetical protein